MIRNFTYTPRYVLNILLFIHKGIVFTDPNPSPHLNSTTRSFRIRIGFERKVPCLHLREANFGIGNTKRIIECENEPIRAIS
jgi:hypothetical protein